MIPSFSEFIFENRDPQVLKQMEKEFDKLKDGDEFLYRSVRYKVIDRNEGAVIGIETDSKYEDVKPKMINLNMFKNYGNVASKK
jgi:hypothetical protein